MINQAFGNVNAKLGRLLASQSSAHTVTDSSEDATRPSALEPFPLPSSTSGESIIRPPNVAPYCCTVGGQQPLFTMLPNQQLVFAPGNLQTMIQSSPVLPSLSITKALSPVPVFLAQRVNSGEVIDMQILLLSNIKCMPGTAQELAKCLSSKDKAFNKVTSLQNWLCYLFCSAIP